MREEKNDLILEISSYMSLRLNRYCSFEDWMDRFNEEHNFTSDELEIIEMYVTKLVNYINLIME